MPVIKEKKKKLSPEEKEQKKHEKRQQRIRDHFNREHNFTQISKQRDQNFYPNLCEKFERLHLLEEINANQQLVKHEQEKREHLLNVYKNYREHAADQHLRLFACHTKLIDNLIALQNIFQNSLHEIYQTNREQLVRDFYAENLHRDKILHDRRIYYKNLAHAYKALMKSREKQNEEKYINQCYELNAAYVIANENLYEKKIKFNQSICDEVSSIYKKFSSFWTKKRLQRYEKLDKLNENEMNVIIEQEKKIREEKFQIIQLKEKIEKIKFEHDYAVGKSKGFYNFLFEHYKGLLENIKTDEKESDVKIKMILTKSAKFKKRLLKLVEIGNNIERTIKLCKKHEKLDDIMNFKDHDDKTNFNLTALKDSKDVEDNFNIPAKEISGLIEKDALKCKEIISQSSLNFESFKTSKIDDFEIEHQKTKNYVNSSNNCFLLNLYQSIFLLQSQNNKEINEETKIKPFVRFNEKFSSETSIENLEMFKTSENDDKTQKLNSLNFSVDSFNHHFASHTSDFFMKIARVEADCIHLQNYKQKLEKENQEIKELINKNKKKLEVDKNLKILNLNQSKSVGKIGQISHQITQIRDKIRQK